MLGRGNCATGSHLLVTGMSDSVYPERLLSYLKPADCGAMRCFVNCGCGMGSMLRAPASSRLRHIYTALERLLMTVFCFV